MVIFANAILSKHAKMRAQRLDNGEEVDKTRTAPQTVSTHIEKNTG